MLSSRDDVEVSVFTQDRRKARAWTDILRRERLTIIAGQGDDERVAFTAGSFEVTSDPEQAARGSDIVIFALPAFLHRRYLISLAPHLENGCLVVGLPGQCGFEFDVRDVLGDVLPHFSIMNFDSLPWVCRIVEFGRTVRLASTKQVITGALHGDPPATRVGDPVGTLQSLLGNQPQLDVYGHLLGITLRSPNAAAHPPMMYSRWKDWDGLPLESPPLFYEALDEDGSEVLAAVNRELLETVERIMDHRPEVDLSQVVPAYDWEIACYGRDIEDKTNLMTAVRTNSGYAGIEHPMVKVGHGQFVPDFQHRFLVEDLPFGLAVHRGIAELADVPTPTIDRVLSWGQDRLEKEYLTTAGLAGRDLAETRTPQRYGLTLDDVLGGVGASDAVAPAARGLHGVARAT